MNILVINDTDYFGFVFSNDEFTIFQLITVGGKSAIPTSLTGFLFAALHSLYKNVFAFDLGNCR